MCLFLIVIVLVALWGNFVTSVIISLIAVECLIYFFTTPLFDFIRIDDPFEAVVAVTFLIVSGAVTAFASFMRRSK